MLRRVRMAELSAGVLVIGYGTGWNIAAALFAPAARRFYFS